MAITRAFYELYEAAAEIAVADHSTEQDLAARLDCGGFTEIIIIIKAEAGSGNTIDVDIEEANALTGGTLQSFDSGGKDVTVADGDTWRIIRLRTAEFSAGFGYLNVEATPSAARMFTISVYGLVKQAPAATTNLDGITD